MDSPPSPPPPPPVFNYVVGFLLVGLAWGLTTPFIRRAARTHTPRRHPSLESDDLGPLTRKVYGAWFAVLDLLRNPRYVIPLGLNLTGSLWFFLLIGQAGRFIKARVLSISPIPSHRRLFSSYPFLIIPNSHVLPPVIPSVPLGDG